MSGIKIKGFKEFLADVGYLDIGHKSEDSEGWAWNGTKIELFMFHKTKHVNMWKGRYDPSLQMVSIVPPEYRVKKYDETGESVMVPRQLINALKKEFAVSGILRMKTFGGAEL